MPLDPDPKRLSCLHSQHQNSAARLELRTGWVVPQVYTTSAEETAALRDRVGLIDISALGKLSLKGAKADGIITANLGESPTQPGEVIAVISTRLLVAKLTADELLILTPPGAEQKTSASLEAEIASQNTFVSIINQTSELVGLSVAGPKSTRVLRKLCPLDFNDTDFSHLHVAQSSFAKTRATIIRRDQGEIPAFELFADRSYGGYLWDTILDAGQEFGIQPVGWMSLSDVSTNNV